MCGVSGIELIVIVVAAVIFLGPDRLPELARSVGKLARDLRNATDDFASVRDEITTVRDGIDRAKKDFGNKIDKEKLLESLDVSSEPRRRPTRESQQRAAIAAVREQKELASAAVGAAAAGVAAEAEATDAESQDEHTTGTASGVAPAEVDNAPENDQLADDLEAMDASGDEVPLTGDEALAGVATSAADEPERPNAPPLDQRYSPEGETEWLRQRLKQALDAQRAKETEGLPEVRPATGTMAHGEGIEDLEAEEPDAPSPAEQVDESSRRDS